MPNERKRDFSISLLPVDAKLELIFRCNLLVGMASLCDKGLKKQALFNDYRHIVAGGFEIMQGVAGASSVDICDIWPGIASLWLIELQNLTQSALWFAYCGSRRCQCGDFMNIIFE